MVIDRLKKIIGKGPVIDKRVLDRLAGMTETQKDEELQSMLYEMAFQNAVRFTYDELKKQGHFSGLDRNTFFNEMLLVNFWMMEKVFSKYRPGIAKKMHLHYFGLLPDMAERYAALMSRFRTYNLCWDEFTGHHDEFGLEVGKNLFGNEAVYPEKTVSFWLISYTDESIKRYKKVRKELREAGLIVKKEE